MPKLYPSAKASCSLSILTELLSVILLLFLFSGLWEVLCHLFLNKISTLIISSSFFLAKPYSTVLYVPIVCIFFTFPWARLSTLRAFIRIPEMHFLYVCIKCGLQKYSMHIIVLTKKGAKGFASQGQRTLFFKLSVKNQSRHFYHIKQSGAFNRYVTGRKAVWTSWPVFLWEKPAGPKFLFFAMVIIMLEMLNGGTWSKAGFGHVKVLPSLPAWSAVPCVWRCSWVWWVLYLMSVSATWYWVVGDQRG